MTAVPTRDPPHGASACAAHLLPMLPWSRRGGAVSPPLRLVRRTPPPGPRQGRRLVAGRRAANERADVLVGGRNHTDQLTDRRCRVLGDEPLAQHAVAARDELHDRLVGLDFGEDVAALHGVALVLVPLHQAPLFHRRRERFHQHFGRHRQSSGVWDQSRYSDLLRTAAIVFGNVGLGGLLETLRVRHRHVGLVHAQHRRIEVVEAVALHVVDDLRADAANSQPSSSTTRDWSSAPTSMIASIVQRADRAQVDDVERDAVLGQLVGGLHRDEHHLAERDDRAVLALALELGLAERDDVLVVRHFALGVVEHLAFEEAHRVVVADGGLEQSLGVVRRAGRDHLEAGDVREPATPTPASAARRAAAPRRSVRGTRSAC